MPKYYLTFGVQYTNNSHPHVPSIDPNGYVQIDAVSESDARAEAHSIFGDKWAFLYPEKNWSEKNTIHFPLGQIATLDEIKALPLDSFFYLQNKAVPDNQILSEKEFSETLSPAQLMVMNNISTLLNRMATFPRVDRYNKEIDAAMQNIKAGLKDEWVGNVSVLERLVKEIIATVRDIND